MVNLAGYLVQAAEMALVLALAPAVTGLVRKLKARLLRKKGPPVFQPYLNLIRLMRKDAVLADNASWLFRAAPPPGIAASRNPCRTASTARAVSPSRSAASWAALCSTPAKPCTCRRRAIPRPPA